MSYGYRNRPLEELMMDIDVSTWLIIRHFYKSRKHKVLNLNMRTEIYHSPENYQLIDQ